MNYTSFRSFLDIVAFRLLLKSVLIHGFHYLCRTNVAGGRTLRDMYRGVVTLQVLLFHLPWISVCG